MPHLLLYLPTSRTTSHSCETDPKPRHQGSDQGQTKNARKPFAVKMSREPHQRSSRTIHSHKSETDSSQAVTGRESVKRGRGGGSSEHEGQGQARPSRRQFPSPGEEEVVGPTTPTHGSREKEAPNEVIKLHGAGVVHLCDLLELCVDARQTKIAHEPVRAPPSRPISDLDVTAQPSRSCTGVEKFHYVHPQSFLLAMMDAGLHSRLSTHAVRTERPPAR